MKKSIILSAFVLAALTASAQTTVQGSKFTDNWSIELKTGIITPVSHSAFFKNARPALGIEFTKQLTPVFGLGVQGMGYINTSNSHGLHPTVSEKGEKELLHLQKVNYPKGEVKEQVKHTARTLLECYNVHSLS